VRCRLSAYLWLHVSLGLLVFLAAPYLVTAQSPSGSADLSAVLVEFEGYKERVAKARAFAQVELDRLRASELDRRLSASNAALYTGHLQAVDEWIETMRSHGSVDQPYLDRIRATMGTWQLRVDTFEQALKAVATERERVRTVPDYCKGSESLSCIEASRQRSAGFRRPVGHRLLPSQAEHPRSRQWRLITPVADGHAVAMAEFAGGQLLGHAADIRTVPVSPAR
jgi:hypothetical protein